MVVCGYDNKMGEGLRLLFEGVIAALERTADTDGVSLRGLRWFTSSMRLDGGRTQR